jgi:hypothetical protein
MPLQQQQRIVTQLQQQKLPVFGTARRAAVVLVVVQVATSGNGVNGGRSGKKIGRALKYLRLLSVLGNLTGNLAHNSSW